MSVCAQLCPSCIYFVYIWVTVVWGKTRTGHESICQGCFPIHGKKKTWVIATTLDPDMLGVGLTSSTEQSLPGQLSFLKQWQLWENNLWKMFFVFFLAAVHVIILTSTFVLLWHYKALGVYFWFGMCSFPLWFMLQMKEVQQVSLPYDRADLSLLWLSLQTLFIVPDVAERRDVLSHVNSISIFLVWKVCVWLCVCSRKW